MDIITLILIAVGLAMDAFAVAVCKGLKMHKINYRHGFIIAAFFGVFQAAMPLIGWLLVTNFSNYIVSYSHWVAFVLLCFIGGKMLWEALKNSDDEDEDECNEALNFKELFMLSIATSIDALAVGVAFALMDIGEILYSVAIIGVITFALSLAGVIIGNNFGAKFKKRAEIVGGSILILMGLKILIEGLFFS